MTALTDAMLEYAQCIRGDWNNFDGRSERDVIEMWVREIQEPEGFTLEQWRDKLGMCPDGNGHWAGFTYGHCYAESCPISAEREKQ
jgi:GH24 family phage-related lysozyme (muramidase)